MATNIPEVSTLLTKDFNDEIVVMQLMSHPRPELVIAGLIKIINKERSEYSKVLEEISERINRIETKANNLNSNVDMATNMVNFVKESMNKDKEENKKE